MAINMKYFIGNWKMFGKPNSINILNKVNSFIKTDKKHNKKYKVVIMPPFTLIEQFAKKFINQKIDIGAQNCFYKDKFGSNTAAISPYMVKATKSKYVIIGHSDNRSEGETDLMLKEKLNIALKNRLKVVFCIGENKKQKKKKQTLKVLKNQLTKVLNKKFDPNYILVAYEPIWSIGTGKIPSFNDLVKLSKSIRGVLKKIFKSKKKLPILYGGSVDSSNIKQFKSIKEIDGFLIGGASKSSKKFIDIIKNYYR